MVWDLFYSSDVTVQYYFLDVLIGVVLIVKKNKLNTSRINE
jgi:hypothetical protein